MAPVFITWLKGHLLPCPFKYFTGIDCPGCGFQRSVIALVQGDLKVSLLLYPATIPLLLAIAYTVADNFYKLDTPKKTIKKSAYITVGSVMLISYTIKMVHLYWL
ncbi:hypothetical protein BC343_07300 [Mucilaginibacter pedocola]|uniref:DUF2752 domain-containing protein n=1 Tax=Mucilaginibacter pedocola TaxID=1792845 RepID=A0A1S9PE73_9SPHI|nr:hypothetical protein BC343_07300 [Mucilaginibacter pedocola]